MWSKNNEFDDASVFGVVSVHIKRFRAAGKVYKESLNIKIPSVPLY